MADDLRKHKVSEGDLVLLINNSTWTVLAFDRFDISPESAEGRLIAKGNRAHVYHQPTPAEGQIMAPEYSGRQDTEYSTQAEEVIVGREAVVAAFSKHPDMRLYAGFFER